MTSVRWFCAATLCAILADPAVQAQGPAQPGPEHEVLKKLVGDWDTTLASEGMESKGKVTYKMDLGGLWLHSTMESDLGGMKYSGRGYDTYDANKKKYVGIWIDSMSTSPMVMEGDYDKEKKTMTMTGEGPGMDGKPAKWRSVTTMPDDDTLIMKMYVGDGQEPMFTVTYKRKK